MSTFLDGPEPAGQNTANSFLIVDGATDLIAFMAEVFDATEVSEVRSPDMYAADGSLIHAEVRIGTSLLMLADRKAGWPFTPAFTQVYVNDIEQTLHRAVARGATIVTEPSPFYSGYDIARFLDPWHNIWWLFSPADDTDASSGEWEERNWEEPAEPDVVYTTLVETMRSLSDPSAARS